MTAPSLLSPDFEAWLELSPGTHPIEITAEDYSDNSITQTFSVHIADEGQVFLTYDLNGNLLTRISDTTVTTYEWDAANRLIAIEVEGETRSEFLYDGLSRRVRITEYAWNATTEDWQLTTDYRYLWDGLTIAEQRSGANGETVKKHFFPQGVEIVTGPEFGSYTYRTDHLGSVREVVDSFGNLTARFDYSPWGELETVSGNFDLDFGFTGHFIHQPTGLYLALFRAYDAGLGRWLSRDPLGFVDGPNLYAYSLNNPIIYFDPLGLTTWWNPFTYNRDDWRAFGQGAKQGGAAYADGFIPFVDPFKESGVYDDCDDLRASRLLGQLGRNAALTATGGIVASSIIRASPGATPFGQMSMGNQALISNNIGVAIANSSGTVGQIGGAGFTGFQMGSHLSFGVSAYDYLSNENPKGCQ